MNRQPRALSWSVIRLAVTIVLPLAILVGGIMSLFYHLDTKAGFEILKAKEINLVDLQNEAIISDFDTVATDLIFLAKTAHLHHIYKDSNPEEIEHIAEEFGTFSKRKELYDQIRYVDLDGREVVRVEYNNGEPVIVPRADLQDKSERYYFKETVVLGLDEIYTSSFDLNVEHGEVERPFRSIIRFGTPVFDKTGKKNGVLVLNYMGVNIKRHLSRLAVNGAGATMLLNKEGYWLHSPEPEDEWGFLLEERHGASFTARYAEEWFLVTDSESGQVETSNGLFTFKTVYPYQHALLSSGPLPSQNSTESPVLESPAPVKWKLVSFVDSRTLALHSGVLVRRLLFIYLCLFTIIVAGAWYTAYSITSRKAAETARRESEERYSMVHTTSLDSIIIADSSGIITEGNPRTSEIFGYSPEELVGMKFSRLMPEKYVASYKAVVSTLLNSGVQGEQGRVVELEGVKKSGTLFPAEVTVNSFVLGPEAYLSITLRDTTERRSMEETLKESEAMYRDLVTTSQNLIWRCDNGGNFTFLNPAWEKTLDYTVEEMLGRPFSDFQTPEAAAYDLKVFSESKEEGEVSGHETAYLSKTGADVYLVFNALPMVDTEGSVIGWQGTANDITEHKRLEKGLRTLSHAIEQIPTSVIITDTEGTIEYVNPKFTENLGYTLGTVMEQNISMLNSELQPASFYADLLAEVRGGAVWHGDASFKKKSGETVWELITVSSILGSEGAPTHLLFVKVDDTERKRAEEALTRSEASLAEAQRIAHVGNWTWDIVANTITWSDEAYRVFGFAPQSVAVDYDLFIGTVHPEDRAVIEARLERALKSFQPYRVEHRIVRTGGEERTVLQNGEVECDEDGKPVRMIGTVSDVTERNRLETEVLKAQKLESVGVLAGGIAHDFNNILTGVLGNISMAKITVDPEGSVFKRLAEAEKATEQARGLTQHLLTFSKGGEPVKSVVALGPVVRSAALFALRGSNVRFDCSVAEDLWATEVDEGQIVQVINNLIINADQAMPEGGDISVICENIAVSEGSALQLSVGEYVAVTVEDHGCGIDSENRTKVFDPYFTTKKEGSGLGLAATYSIIKKHGGRIDMESTSGVGTTFRLYLKATKAPVTALSVEDPRPVPGTGRILVMDDEKGIRGLLTVMLEHLGYEVKTTKDGASAIESYRVALKNGKGYDAVIMDLTIPGGMGGREAIKRLLEIDPDVQAIVSSGYSNDPVMAQYARYGFSGVLAKPYMTGSLSKVLYGVIGKG
ncbi:MAG: PAS domain S-box protein [Proteobacteria bacterium]|nr:PAS domain S-box protein [Pseudomonadota bacterium]